MLRRLREEPAQRTGGLNPDSTRILNGYLTLFGRGFHRPAPGLPEAAASHLSPPSLPLSLSLSLHRRPGRPGPGPLRAGRQGLSAPGVRAVVPGYQLTHKL